MIEVITLGAGCFWCVEAVFQDINGVVSAVSGYMGGESKNPNYEEVCTGNSGHVEVCEITFDTDKIKLNELLKLFWNSHDPTTLNRQGNDIGSQYRSVIFYNDQNQKEICINETQKLENAKIYKNSIVTAIEPATKFYKAEEYHQNYYKKNPNQSYCYYIIKPKLDKLKKIN